jgi:hypothetical protein
MSRSLRLALALFILAGIAGPTEAPADTLTGNFTLTPTTGSAGGTGSFTVTAPVPITNLGLLTFTTTLPPFLFLQSLDVEIGGHDFSLANAITIFHPSVTLFNENLVGMEYLGLIIEPQNSFQLFLNGSIYAYSELPNGSNNASGTITASPATPLPSTLPLFATGLGALGLLGWRRKRGVGKIATKKYLLIASALVCSLLNLSTAFANTVYDVVDQGLFIRISGTITTDGTNGILSSTNIIDWNLAFLNLADLLSSITLTPIQSPTLGNSVVIVTGSDLSASPTSLTFNYSDTTSSAGALTFLGASCPPACAQFGYLSAAHFPPGSVFVLLGDQGFNSDFASGDRSGTQVIATAEATPLPAALPLFATGVGALGLLGWRRKRKQAA